MTFRGITIGRTHHTNKRTHARTRTRARDPRFPHGSGHKPRPPPMHNRARARYRRRADPEMIYDHANSDHSVGKQHQSMSNCYLRARAARTVQRGARGRGGGGRMDDGWGSIDRSIDRSSNARFEGFRRRLILSRRRRSSCVHTFFFLIVPVALDVRASARPRRRPSRQARQRVEELGRRSSSAASSAAEVRRRKSRAADPPLLPLLCCRRRRITSR